MSGLFDQPFEVREQRLCDDIFVRHTKEMCKRDLLRDWGSKALFYSGIVLPVLSVQYRGGVYWCLHYRWWHPLFWVYVLILFFITFLMGGGHAVSDFFREFPNSRMPRKERKYHYFNAANGIKVVVTQKH